MCIQNKTSTNAVQRRRSHPLFFYYIKLAEIISANLSCFLIKLPHPLENPNIILENTIYWTNKTLKKLISLSEKEDKTISSDKVEFVIS